MMKNNKFSEGISFIKVKKNDGQKFINFISSSFQKDKIFESKFKIIHNNDYILFPLKEKNESTQVLSKKIGNTFEFQIISMKPRRKQKFNFISIEEALKNIIPNEYNVKYFQLIPKSYDIIGNIAIIEFKKFTSNEDNDIKLIKEKIAEALALVNKNVQTVYEKSSEIKGAYRLRSFNLLFGKNISETIHKENNCIFKLDIKKTFFSPRLVFERKRLSSFETKNNEIIADMFAGVGPISIQIVKNHKVKIYAFDINIDAFNYLVENVELNKVTGKIIPYNIDIKDLLNPSNRLGNFLKNKIDRIIMNLPENSIDFLDVACFLMKKSGGIIHNYQISDKPFSIENAIEKLNINLKKNNCFIEKIINKRIVKTYSPKSDLVAIDLKIKNFHT